MSDRSGSRGVQVPRFAKARYVVPLAALALLVGGISYAAIPGFDGAISACYKNGSGDLRVIDAEAGETCRRRETPIAWPSRDRFSRAFAEGPAHTGELYEEPAGTEFAAGLRRVARLTIPSGFWALTAKVTIDTEAAQFSDCFLTYDEGSGATQVDFSSQQSDAVTTALTTHNLQGLIGVSEAEATVDLSCNAGTPDGFQDFIAVSPKIMAVEVHEPILNGVPIG